MRTECNAGLFDFAPVEGRQVIAAFDGGVITSDAGALLLGATDRAIRLTERFSACFADRRMPELVEHSSGPWCCSACSASRSVTRTSPTMMSSGMTRFLRCWRGNSRHVGRTAQRSPARAR